jgi:hypothetical protein
VYHAGVKAGIQPRLLNQQVRNTAAWLWDDPRAKAVTATLDQVDEADRDMRAGGLAYTRLMLAAHFATVATFVPTDVDARIRHHVWAAMEDAGAIAAACDVVDEVARWDARWVSARTVDVEHAPLSGHDGEWLGVRAGALGRALALGADDLVTRLVLDLDRELDRESGAFEQALRGGAPARRVLSIATILAHNLGDLSRVVEQWPQRPELAAIRAKYTRLGHPDATDRRFVLAGHINKAVMALENHRFLALRKPRALRTSRALLLPIGPWFDAWGETVASTLDEKDRVEVVTALLELHLSSPDQQGCLRALAGIHRATRGGLELYVPDLPARIRKEATRGRVREALDITPEHFEARMDRRYRIEREVR